ncbi:N-acetylmuramidase domain-containing protein [Halomonas binhaiensis]|uniref:N-acetylmuramidase family protein n=1 Tax=Halomonas binhaiensis TaxID=2562282 RepID=A0A5C1NB95_9GAMM|nr:N-acetylmuramidase family protein [Halomonas binhaiensis]QEM80220.1 N-acetylmuramidase family protein [Halomonas binhaiensis]
MLLKHGDTGYQVESLQRDLQRVGHDIAADGWYGDITEAAVRAVQREHGLVMDGIVGPKTRQALQRHAEPNALKQIDLVNAANRLDVELAAIMAINEVESRGRGFYVGGPRHGQPIILFERHIMRRRLIHHEINPVPLQQKHPDLVNDKPGGYIGGYREHGRLERAANLHVTSALESASWGAFQIMGYHWSVLEYANVGEFVGAMEESEATQLEAFVRFIEVDAGLHRALKRQDWRDFARRYNGPAFERNDYDTRLAAAYRRHDRQLEVAA